MVTWPQIPVDVDAEYTMCFGCGKENPIGLKLSFEWDGKTARAEFNPSELYQGWARCLHGGIVSCLIDEATAYAALFSGAYCITAKMEIRFRRLALIDETLIITSNVTKKTKRLIETKADISLKDGTPIAEGTSTQFVIKTRETPLDNVSNQG